MVQNMPGKGNCLDNAVTGSFFSTLTKAYRNTDELKQAICEYIHYYNPKPVRLRLKGLSPVEYRTQAFGSVQSLVV